MDDWRLQIQKYLYKIFKVYYNTYCIKQFFSRFYFFSDVYKNLKMHKIHILIISILLLNILYIFARYIYNV